MVAWRVAKCLLTLRDQWKAEHPGAANPGFIGDAAHAARTSDHNPWVDDPTSTVNVVTAGDFYHQPSIGADAGELAEALKQAKDRRVKYVIWNRRIWSLARDREGWRKYNGTDPHTGHVHVSVTSSYPLYDRTSPWDITTGEDDDVISNEQMTELKNHISAEANAAARRWALWVVRYGIQTEDERAAAEAAYTKAIDAGKTPQEAMAAVVAVMRPLDDDIAKVQASKA